MVDILLLKFTFTSRATRAPLGDNRVRLLNMGAAVALALGIDDILGPALLIIYLLCHTRAGKMNVLPYRRMSSGSGIDRLVDTVVLYR